MATIPSNPLLVPRELPLADLHRHLDGSIRRSTLNELAKQAGVEVPEDLLFQPGMGLSDALERFQFTLNLMQTPDVVRRIARETVEDARAENVTTLEVRFAPQLHKTAPIEAIVDAALEGLDGGAGLILCGLYGENPKVMDDLVEVARTRSGVVGIDLAGGPTEEHEFGMPQYVRAFRRAEDLGIGRTVHAGEGRPSAEVRYAIEFLHAQRIGHGTTILEDTYVFDLVRRKGITIESCPTSNVHTGVVPTHSAHPLPRWLELGVSVCVCTDNTLLSGVTARQELARAAAIPGMDLEKVRQAIENGHEGAFKRRKV